MPLTPDDVRSKEFRNSFRGYNEPEVDAFLDEVEAELVRLLRENAELRDRASAAAAVAQQAPVPSPMGETEEMLRRTLLLAQRTADETVASARAEADRIVADAQAHTQQLVNHAQQQAGAQIADLDNRRKSLEQHIEGLRAFEREYRTRLKAYLETQLRDLDIRGEAAAPVSAPPVALAPAAAQPAQPAQSALPPAAGVSAAPAIPVVEDSPQVPNWQPTDIPGGFVRRSE